MKTAFSPRIVAAAVGLGLFTPLFANEPAPDGRSQKAAVGGVQVAKVDLNTADIPTLEAVPEIGTSLANAVVAARPFKSVEDFERALKLPAEKATALRAKVFVSPVKASGSTPAEPPPKGVAKPSTIKDGKATPHQEVTDRYDNAQGAKKKEQR